jgi:hypothetical protein
LCLHILFSFLHETKRQRGPFISHQQRDTIDDIQYFIKAGWKPAVRIAGFQPALSLNRVSCVFGMTHLRQVGTVYRTVVFRQLFRNVFFLNMLN